MAAVVCPVGPDPGPGSCATARRSSAPAREEPEVPACVENLNRPLLELSMPSTRMSPAGTPRAFTVMALPEPIACTVILPAGMADAGSESMLGQPALTGTTTTRPSPSCRSVRVGPGDPGLLVDRERHRAVGVRGHRVGRGAASADQRASRRWPRRRRPPAPAVSITGRAATVPLRGRGHPGVCQRRAVFPHEIVEELVGEPGHFPVTLIWLVIVLRAASAVPSGRRARSAGACGRPACAAGRGRA